MKLLLLQRPNHLLCCIHSNESSSFMCQSHVHLMVHKQRDSQSVTPKAWTQTSVTPHHQNKLKSAVPERPSEPESVLTKTSLPIKGNFFNDFISSNASFLFDVQCPETAFKSKEPTLDSLQTRSMFILKQTEGGSCSRWSHSAQALARSVTLYFSRQAQVNAKEDETLPMQEAGGRRLQDKHVNDRTCMAPSGTAKHQTLDSSSSLLLRLEVTIPVSLMFLPTCVKVKAQGPDSHVLGQQDRPGGLQLNEV